MLSVDEPTRGRGELASDALKMNAENAQALVTRAKAYVSTQNETRAKKDIAQAHALVPNDAQIKQLHDIIHGLGTGRRRRG